jgi:hypothetical protein
MSGEMGRGRCRRVKTNGSGIAALLARRGVAGFRREAGLFLGAGFGFTSGLLQTAADEDLRDLLRAEVVVEF